MSRFAPMALCGAAAVAATIAAFAAAGAARAAATPISGPGATFGAETFTLANGMQAVVVPNRRAPLVHHAVWYKAGAADEPPGKSGVAHMLEHMMFKGLAGAADDGFSETVARNGGNDNAFTGQDYTGYYQNIAVDRLALVMRLEAGRMTELAFDDAAFELEREVVLEERRSRVENRPGSVFREQVAAAQYLAHPYGVPTIGWEHEIRALTPADAMAFYRARYAPNNAVLVVAGDIDAETLRPLAEEIYGRIPARPLAARARPGEPPQRAARRVEMSDPRVTAREWSRSYLAPSLSSDPDGIAVALELFATVLGGGTTGRLYRGLVVERGIATDAGAWYSGVGLDHSRFGIHVSPVPGVAIADVEAAVDAEIARLLDEGATADELERAKFGVRAFSIYSRDSLQTLARLFGSALTTGLTVEDVERWPAAAAAVTAEQAAAAGRAALVPERSVTALLSPAEPPEAAP